MTSPNSLYIVPSLHGMRQIHMRRDFHFGEEDPLYFPQLYTPGIGHLSIIPYPTSDPTSPHLSAWKMPRQEDFTPTNPDDPSRGLGSLTPQFRAPLRNAFDALYIFDIKFLLAHLNTLSSFREAALTFSLCQRAYLELAAHIEWLSVYRPRVHNPPSVRPLEEANVVGALTGDSETAERLFYAGIPVWYLQPLDQKDSTRVDRWLNAESSAFMQRFEDNGFRLSLEDESPPHPVVFKGRISDISRYKEMGQYLRRFSTTNVFMEDTDFTVSPPPPSEPSSRPACTGKQAKQSRAQREPVKFSQSSSLQTRNKFLDVISPAIPPALPVWSEACVQAGASFNPNTPPPNGHDNGYAFPDPNIIAGTANDSTRAMFIMTWLKLRPVLFYRLRSPTFQPLKTKQWRSVLGLEVHSLKSDTLAAKLRAEQQKMLQECLDTGNMQGSINLDKLSNATVKWQGSALPPATLPPVHIVHQILWELFEANFRYELVALDHFCYRTDITKSEREQQVLGYIRHFNNTIIPHSLAAAHSSFGSKSLNTADGKRHALYGLYLVMEGWTGGPGELPRTIRNSTVKQRLDIQQTPVVEFLELKDLEFAFVHHYVSVFRSVFARAPLLPHTLSESV
ncbi:hypothetical protein E1B28_012042 [Marasmius oreades]|uniref:Uncharacterized protein n=1 Tax=Marasmius oreades TaxID=181124 RepID=A0A9P7RRZ6_9AGAR|nr:uncharacterized protein E1B28_012042 [Marasmius oreades]KAG7088003.1 hypothetical protein E1B28_012042 [Marasmius oreades]